MAATEDDDRPKKKIAHEIGQDLTLMSVGELAERVAILKEEIARAEPSAMSRPSASTMTQSLISWTMSMSCSTNRTVRPSSFNPLM